MHLRLHWMKTMMVVNQHIFLRSKNLVKVCTLHDKLTHAICVLPSDVKRTTKVSAIELLKKTHEEKTKLKREELEV